MSDLPMPFTEDTEALVTAPGWVPADDLAVERSLRYLDHLSREFQEARDRAATWRAEIDRWEAQQTGAISTKATAVGVALEAYALARRRESGVKALDYPSGRLETRKGRDKTTVVDELALLAWCESEAPDAVKVTKSVLVSKLPEHVIVDGRLLVGGEIVPGITAVSGDNYVSASIKLASARELPKPAKS